MVRVTSVPEGVFRGAERVTVPLALFPASRNKLVGDAKSKPWLLVARMEMFPSISWLIAEKGTEKGVPGSRMLLESA